MEDARITAEVDSLRLLRAQRRKAGVVAQYIHELSNRHVGSRRRPVAGRPRRSTR